MAKRIHGSGIPLEGSLGFHLDMYDWEYRVSLGESDYRASFGFWTRSGR